MSSTFVYFEGMYLSGIPMCSMPFLNRGERLIKLLKKISILSNELGNYDTCDYTHDTNLTAILKLFMSKNTERSDYEKG